MDEENNTLKWSPEPPAARSQQASQALPIVDRKKRIIVGTQLALLACANLAGIYIGYETSRYDMMSQLTFAMGCTILLLGVSFMAALIMSVLQRPTAPSWWSALGLVAVLAVPACLVYPGIIILLQSVG